MNVTKINDAGGKFTYLWPKNKEDFENFVEYTATSENGGQSMKIGFGERYAYGKKERE